jgi:hypothetical protein
MKGGQFIRFSVEAAICEAPGARRASARRLWVSHLAPSAILVKQARSIIALCPPLPGRVHALGEFDDAQVHGMLTMVLPHSCALRLSNRLEWYACRGAGFHNDAHYTDVLFGAWCVAGPKRDIVFPRVATRIGAAVGDLAIFDPFEPHAVLDEGHDAYSRDRYEGAAPSLFIGFEIALDAAAHAAFAIAAPPVLGAVLSSSVPINAETGALP